MKLVASTFLLLMLAVPVARGQAAQRPKRHTGTQWREVQAKEVKLAVRLPVQWQTKAASRNGQACLEAISPKSSIYLQACSFRNGELTLDDLLDRTLDQLDVDLDDDPEEERINGLDALVGETTATFNGRDLGLFIVAAAYGDTRYVITVMTKARLFDANARTMNRIVDSLAPIESDGRQQQ